MLYIVCPTCGFLLGNKEEIYYKKMSDLCEEYGVDDNMLSLGILNNDKDHDQECRPNPIFLDFLESYIM